MWVYVYLVGAIVHGAIWMVLEERTPEAERRGSVQGLAVFALLWPMTLIAVLLIALVAMVGKRT